MDAFYDDPVETYEVTPGSKRKPKVILAVSIIAAFLFLQNTLAANINVNSGQAVEFGQGVQITTACDSNIKLVPEAVFVNSAGSGAYYFKRFSLQGIDSQKCDGVSFSLRAYGETSSVPLELYLGSTSAVIQQVGSSYSVAAGQTGLSLIESTTGTFKAQFDSPLALASNVKRITVESSGDGRTVFSSVVISSFNITYISTGDDLSCGITSSSGLYCWGANNIGQLGVGYISASRITPQAVNSLANVTEVSVDRSSGPCALVSGGDVYCWGETGNGRIGDGLNTSSSTPIKVTLGAAASAISTGGGTSCALLSTGTVKCWGYNFWGQVGDNTDGVGGSGSSSVLSPSAVTGLSNVTQISKGSGSTTCALKSNGTVFCWGYGTPGTLGDGVDHSGNYCWSGSTPNCSVKVPVQVSGITTATSISVGDNHACALLSGGNVKCWGSNSYYKLGVQTAPNMCNLGRQECAMSPGNVAGVTSVIKISAGANNTCALTSGGDVYCWGAYGLGLLGTATSSDSFTPVKINGISNASDVKVGSEYVCAILPAGQVKCWGRNSNGQFGNGTTTSSASPS